MCVHSLMLWWSPSLTCTDNSSILVMSAVVLSPAQIEAVCQFRLVAPAVDVIQQYGTRTVAEVSQRFGCNRWAASQLSTDHQSAIHVPVIVTHCSPDCVVKYLHAPLTTAIAVYHADARFSWRGDGSKIFKR